MSRINNYEELMVERSRLEFKLIEHKKILSTGLQELKEKLVPFMNLLPLLNLFAKKTTGGSVLAAVVSSGVDLLVGPNMSPKLAWVAKLILSFISKRLSNRSTKIQPL